MALQYILDNLIPSVDYYTNGTYDRVKKYVIDHSVELSDRASCTSPSAASSFSDNLNSSNYGDDDNSYTSSTQFDMSVSQLSNYSSSSASINNIPNTDDFKEAPHTQLLKIPSELKPYMDCYPNVLKAIQNNIDLMSGECTDLENYVKSGFGIFSLMKEVMTPQQKNTQQKQNNLEMIAEMTDILQEKITAMELAAKNLNSTQVTFQNIVDTLNSTPM